MIHPVWTSSDMKKEPKIWTRLENRLDEMKERKKRLLASKGIIENNDDRKRGIVRGLSAI